MSETTTLTVVDAESTAITVVSGDGEDTITVLGGEEAPVTVIGTVPNGPPGVDGADGTDGTDGVDGEGVPTGGALGQVLTKQSGTDFDTDWEDPTGGGGVTDATYLTATAHAGLSAEVVVGATPGGELGGTWASPTVDATHSGSSHASTQAAAEATAAAALASHEADTTAVHGIANTALLETTAGAQAKVDAHVNDTSDAHDASAISILDTANDFTATDVEAALAELQTADEADEAALAAHLADTTDAHDASAVSFVPNGSIAATDVQAAIQEVRDEAGSGSLDDAVILEPTTALRNVIEGTGDFPALTVKASGQGEEVPIARVVDENGDAIFVIHREATLGNVGEFKYGPDGNAFARFMVVESPGSFQSNFSVNDEVEFFSYEDLVDPTQSYNKLFITAKDGQLDELVEIEGYDGSGYGNIVYRVLVDGTVVSRGHAEPADVELETSSFAVYLDDTVDAPAPMVKMKDSAGTVFTQLVGSASDAVILAPTTSERNVIEGTADVRELTVRAFAGQTEPVFVVEDEDENAILPIGVAPNAIAGSGTMAEIVLPSNASGVAIRVEGEAKPRLMIGVDGNGVIYFGNGTDDAQILHLSAGIVDDIDEGTVPAIHASSRLATGDLYASGYITFGASGAIRSADAVDPSINITGTAPDQNWLINAGGAGGFVIFGDQMRSTSQLEFSEMGDPTTGPGFPATQADAASLFARDNGAGKSELAVEADALITPLLRLFPTLPADADIPDSGLAVAFDDTAGAPEILFKGKDSLGAVFVAQIPMEVP